MPYGITPTSGYPKASAAAFPKYVQIQNAGTPLGDAGVRVLNIVFDPTEAQVTRGIGENSHIVTIKKLTPPPPEIAWFEPVDALGGTLAHANAGSDPSLGFSGIADGELFAGLVGYTGQTVVWSIASWTPVTIGAASPVLTDLGSGTAKITWQNLFSSLAQGELILTATVNGTPIAVGQRLVAVVSADVGEDGYNDVAWGPEP